MARWLPMVDYIQHEFAGRAVRGAEIGVFRGEGSLYMLERLNVEILHLIDPYDYENPDYADLARPHLKDASKEAEERLAEYDDKIRWWQMTSEAAALLIKPGLDFVYIDGNHYYNYVKHDIEDYGKLVKPGGWIGGHDYAEGDVWVDDKPFYLDGGKIQIEVKSAVDEYVARHGYYLFVAGDPAFPDWWVQKGVR